MSKYKSIKMSVDGVEFDSKKEAERYIELCEMMNAGLIDQLECQVRFELIPKMRDADGKCVRPCTYLADFVYRDNETGATIVEDVKGYKTPEYRIKKKLMLQVHGITVREV